MSVRRTTRRYLRGAVDTTHDFQEFLNENPAVAAGLASVGSLLLNAMMQSKYGPTIQGLLNPGASAAAGPTAGAAAAQPEATPEATPKATPKAKSARGSRRVAKKAAKKK